MLKKIKNIIKKTDLFFYKKFGSFKSLKFLQNIREAQEIFSCLDESSSEINVRFVGGCVRKSLTGEQVDDIDLATSLTPDKVKEKLSKKNIKVIDTGLSHGTITAILNKKKFEITTLRKDIETDGRHAKVEFTSDWFEDASRRDFTINAIYADIYGRIFDPFNGISDLKEGKVIFIGKAEERIQEDYLRILRYFRFFIQYGDVNLEEEIIKSIRKNINGVNKISNERIFNELLKILKQKNVNFLFFQPQFKEIILNIFPQFKYYERLKIIDNLSGKLKQTFDNCLILGLLVIDQSDDYEYFCHKYKTSNAIKARFRNISTNFKNFKSKNFFKEENIKKLIYFNGKQSVIDLVLFSICVNKKSNITEIEKLIEYINFFKIPKFPITGEYLKDHGYETGLYLGNKLKNLEEEWIKNNFTIDKKLIFKSLDKHK